MIITSKSLIEIYLTNIPFMLTYTFLILATIFLCKKKLNKFHLCFFVLLSVLSLPLLFDSIDDIFHNPLTIQYITNMILWLSPFYVYIFYHIKFKLGNLSFLLIGMCFEISTLILHLNISDTTRLVWTLSFILSLMPYDKELNRKS